MNLRRLTGLTIGLALSAAFALPAAADFGDDIRDGLDIPTRDDVNVSVDIPDFSIPADGDDDDGDDFVVVLPGDFADVGDDARDDANSLADDIRERVGVGSDD